MQRARDGRRVREGVGRGGDAVALQAPVRLGGSDF